MKRLWPVYLALFLLIVITSAFVLVFLSASGGPVAVMSDTPDAAIYTERTAGLLANASAERGEALVAIYSCTACHVAGVDAGIAPPFVGLAERAAGRRPPLSAESYVYESIVDPMAYVVEGYASTMPLNFAERLSDQRLGDILAYLLR